MCLTILYFFGVGLKKNKKLINSSITFYYNIQMHVGHNYLITFYLIVCVCVWIQVKTVAMHVYFFFVKYKKLFYHVIIHYCFGVLFFVLHTPVYSLMSN